MLTNKKANAESEEKNEKSLERWNDMLGLARDEIFVPEGIPSHEVLLVPAIGVKEITNCSIKTEVRRVISDWDNRQIPRFKYEIF